MSSIMAFVSLPIMVSILLGFECKVRVSLESLEEKNVIDIVNWIFYSPWVLRSFIMLLKYVLFSSR